MCINLERSSILGWVFFLIEPFLGFSGIMNKLIPLDLYLVARCKNYFAQTFTMGD